MVRRGIVNGARSSVALFRQKHSGCFAHYAIKRRRAKKIRPNWADILRKGGYELTVTYTSSYNTFNFSSPRCTCTAIVFFV